MKKIKILSYAILIISIFFFSTSMVLAAENSFADIKEDDWFYDSVLYCLDKGFIKGANPWTFEPYSPSSREVFITILWRMDSALNENKSENIATIEHNFKDLRHPWSKDAISWGASNNLIKGLNEDMFDPERHINIEQVLTILYRYTKYKESKYDFSDYDISTHPVYNETSSYAQDSVKWAIEKQIISPDGVHFEPKSRPSRAKLCYILYRYNERILLENDDIEGIFIGDDIIDKSKTFNNSDGVLITSILNHLAQKNKKAKDFGIYIENLNTNEVFTYNKDEVFTAASTYKLPLAMLYYDRLNEGNIKPNAAYMFRKSDAEPGDVISTNYKVNTYISISTLLEKMIVFSDNTAGNILYKNIGGWEKFQKLASKYSKNTDYATLSKGGNKMNPKYAHDALKHIYLNADKYPKLLQDMGIAKGFLTHKDIPAHIAQKWGYYEGNMHCIGIVYGDNPYIIAVYTRNMKDKEVISEITKISYDYFH